MSSLGAPLAFPLGGDPEEGPEPGVGTPFGNYFGGYFGAYFGFQPDTPVVTSPPAPTFGSLSRIRVLGTVAPRPLVPGWRQIDGAAGEMFTEIRRFLNEAAGRDHLWGNSVRVTFPAALTPVPVPTGLGGPAQGYRIDRRDGDFQVFDADPATPTTDRGIHWLQASAPGTATIYFF